MHAMDSGRCTRLTIYIDIYMTMVTYIHACKLRVHINDMPMYGFRFFGSIANPNPANPRARLFRALVQLFLNV